MCVRKCIQEREYQILEECSRRGFVFKRWVDGYKNAYSKVICSCATHGEWSVSVHNFVNGKRGCPGCHNDATGARCRRGEKEVIDAINSLRNGCKFDSWATAYTGTQSKFNCKCEIHGPWSVSVLHYLHSGTGCPSCAGLKPFSKKEREQQIIKGCEFSGLKFVGWVGPYKNSYSRFIYECPLHGRNEVSVNTFINSGTRCPGCSECGFNKDADAGLYALLSSDGSLVKVGISNTPQERISTLKRKTPFSFSVIGIRAGTGRDILSLEKYFHTKYARAGLFGFDGYTEWLKISDALITELNEVLNVRYSLSRDAASYS